MAVSVAIKRWTLGEVHSLPEDGNKYELIHGELFVTPPPTDDHETIAARLTRILDPYVAANRLGYVYRPRAVFRVRHGRKNVSEVEPDLMVRQPDRNVGTKWEKAPKPSLIVEIASPSTRRRDREHKRDFYIESSIPEYWAIDDDSRSVTVYRPGQPVRSETDTLVWAPSGASGPLVIPVRSLFED